MAEQQQTFVIVGASLTGAKAAQTLRKAKLYVHDETWYDENSVELQLGRRVTTLGRAGRQVEIEGGDRLGYSKHGASGSAVVSISTPGMIRPWIATCSTSKTSGAMLGERNEDH